MSAITEVPHNIPIAYSRNTSNASVLESIAMAHNTHAALAGSFNGMPAPAPTQAQMINPQSSMMSSYNRSFAGDGSIHGGMQAAQPQIYTAVYSGVQVYEMEIQGIAVMRRRSDSWLNATQILKVAGVDKGKRTKVLEKEILTGEHEKVQGGYGKYQGTWISYRRGREFCRQYGVEELLRPLLDYDMGTDGSAGTGQGIETPTKEQAMAANRKRFYTAALDGRSNPQNANGTFFSNISATAAGAIAAMNKVARMNSPAPRPASAAQRRPGSIAPRPSQPPVMSAQDSFRAASQTSIISQASDRSFHGNGQHDSAYGTQNGLHNSNVSVQQDDIQEPPRKKMKSSQEESMSFHHVPNGAEIAMREATPTEPNESFIYRQTNQIAEEDEWPVAMPPLPHPETQELYEKQGLLLDLFADLNRTDFNTHPAIISLSGSDLDLPLDQSANTALHWAATLARVPLMRLLISKGASIFRGNIAGQTPLMSAVQVKNSLDHSCIPELLEILSPLIELRDTQGRTVLHHIAVSCGISGRAASSKYYLEALLEFLVRSTTSQANSFDAATSLSRPMGLMRFMSEIVNAKDRAGNTALNLVARIGNRSIIQQLLEVQADPSIANNKGLKPIDFGVGGEEIAIKNHHAGASGNGMALASQMSIGSPSKGPKSRVEETSREMLPLMTSLLTQTDSQFNAEIRLKQDQIDRSNQTIRELSALARSELNKLDRLQDRVRARKQRQQRLLNLRRSIGERKPRLAQSGLLAAPNARDVARVGDADKSCSINGDLLPPSPTPQHPSIPAITPQQSQYVASLPSSSELRATIAAYSVLNGDLRQLSSDLARRNGESEARYRKVVSLCTGVPEDRVEECLPGLVQAIESEEGSVEVGRVRDFLRKVEGVGGGT